MAKIGLSKPYFAKYSNTAGKTTYTGGAAIGKAVELSMTLEGQNDSILHADNGPAESDNEFGGGSITLKTDDLLPEPMIGILGVKEVPITDNDKITTTGAKWMVFDDEQETPYVGFGAIIKRKINGAVKWSALIYPKIQFQNTGDAATTQGKSIEWQTPELTAALLRDDTVYHEWRRLSSPLDTEAEAEALIRSFLNITDAS